MCPIEAQQRPNAALSRRKNPETDELEFYEITPEESEEAINYILQTLEQLPSVKPGQSKPSNVKQSAVLAFRGDDGYGLRLSGMSRLCRGIWCCVGASLNVTDLADPLTYRAARVGGNWQPLAEIGCRQ